MQALRELLRRHEALKKRIHAFRVPLSRNGQRVMGVVYFCIPLVVGRMLYGMVVAQQEKNFRLDANGKPLELRSMSDERLRENAQSSKRLLEAIMHEAANPAANAATATAAAAATATATAASATTTSRA